MSSGGTGWVWGKNRRKGLWKIPIARRLKEKKRSGDREEGWLLKGGEKN